MREGYIAKAGSERPPIGGASSRGPVAPDEQLSVTVILRPDPSLPPVEAGRIVGREGLAGARAAAAGDVRAIETFAASHGLTVSESDPVRRRVVLSGTAAAMNAAFDVRLERFEHSGGSYRGHAGPVGLPTDLAGSVVAVLGLDDRPQARTHFRRHAQPQSASSYTAVQVARAYDFPTAVDGSGQTIGFIELGGGYVADDLTAYFSQLGLRTPPVTAVPVDSGANHPTGSADGPDGEVMLDLEVAGAVANGAALAVYFAPNTDQGFVDAISAAVHDTTHAPAVVSISWGGPESSYTASARQAFEDVLTDAGLAGVTVCVAAGDNGSSDGVAGGQPTVDYPASSPQVLACGGTTLRLSSGAIEAETVWNDGSGGGATGGGVSAVFALPAWQADAGVPASAGPGGQVGRGVPDVAGDADPATGYQVRVDGTDTVFGGTSAVAPLWAGLLILAVAQTGKPLGFVNPKLYSRFATLPALTEAFNDITSGSNGAYSAGPGWDACTGLGTPKGSAVVSAVG